MIALLQTLSMILTLVWWVFLIMIIMSWLISFNVINTRNQFVAGVWRIINQVTEPILSPIRRVIPPMGGLDSAPSSSSSSSFSSKASSPTTCRGCWGSIEPLTPRRPAGPQTLGNLPRAALEIRLNWGRLFATSSPTFPWGGEGYRRTEQRWPRHGAFPGTVKPEEPSL